MTKKITLEEALKLVEFQHVDGEWGIQNVLGDVSGSVVGSVSGNVFGNVSGDVVGSVFGGVYGDVYGDVFGDVGGFVLNYRGKFEEYLGQKVDELLPNDYVCVPHQSPPFIRDSEYDPPEREDDDRYVRGDHDFHAVMSVGEALFFTGHQQYKVQAAATKYIDENLGTFWLEQMAVDFMCGWHIDCPETQAIMDCDAIGWDCVWPEVGSDLRVTGYLSEGDGLVANYYNKAHIRLTEEQIAELKSEAASHGDEDLVGCCDRCFDDEDALEEVGNAIIKAIEGEQQ